MPNISLTLSGTDQSISRPVVLDIIGQLQDITKINPATKIFFAGDIRRMQTPGTSIDGNDERFAMFNTNNIIFIEVQEDFDINTVGSTAVTRPEQHPVFIDEALDVKVTPVYATTNMVINFRYRCVSKTEALRWRDDIRLRASQMRDINIHDLTYHYVLPLETLVLLKFIHDTKELTAPYNETYEEFIIRNSTDRLTLIGDLVNQDARLAISETQCRVVGLYDWDVLPEKTEREETGVWTVSFSYKFNFEKPIACHMRYPIMVHNNLLPSHYTLFTNAEQDLYHVPKNYPLSLGALAGFEHDTTMDYRRSHEPIIRLPRFDDFEIKHVPTGTGTAIIALCQVDQDKRQLLNLHELGDIALDSDILEFIQLVEYPYICKLYKSIFHISLYRNEHLTYTTTLDCDNTLMVKAVEDLNLRNIHRLRIALVTDLTLLPWEALDRLRRYPKVLVKVIACMNELLRNHPDFVNLGNKSRITELEFSPIYAILTGLNYDNGRGRPKGDFYGEGIRVNAWPNKGHNSYNKTLFRDIDPRIVAQYRNNRTSFNTVMPTGIISIQQSQ